MQKQCCCGCCDQVVGTCQFTSSLKWLLAAPLTLCTHSQMKCPFTARREIKIGLGATDQSQLLLLSSWLCGNFVFTAAYCCWALCNSPSSNCIVVYVILIAGQLLWYSSNTTHTAGQEQLERKMSQTIGQTNNNNNNNKAQRWWWSSAGGVAVSLFGVTRVC